MRLCLLLIGDEPKREALSRGEHDRVCGGGNLSAREGVASAQRDRRQPAVCDRSKGGQGGLLDPPKK